MDSPNVPETPQATCRLWTRWCDEDNQAVLNNAVYMTLFEEARRVFFGERGLLEGNRFPFLLAQTNVRFLRPGRGGVEVTVELTTTHAGSSSFRQSYRVRHGEDVWCEAEAALVCYDPESGRPAPMSPAFRAALAVG